MTEPIDIDALLKKLDQVVPSKRKLKAMVRKAQSKNECKYCDHKRPIVKYGRCSVCLPEHEKWLAKNNSKKPPKLSGQGYLYGYDKNGKHGLVHRHVMEEHLGRELLPHESVAFWDGDKTNVDISNLVLVLKRGIPLAELKCPCCDTPYLDATYQYPQTLVSSSSSTTPEEEPLSGFDLI